MTYILTLICPPDSHALTMPMIESLTPLVGAKRLEWLEDNVACDLCDIDTPLNSSEPLQQIIGNAPIDWCFQPAHNRRKQLLISDMDSTIIQQECIDELGAHLGIGKDIARITERAMEGELDFTASLKERVALLKGMDVSVIDTLWEQKIHLTDGAATLLATMNAHGAHTMLVSGGFTLFTKHVAETLHFAEHHANTLITSAQMLTGEVAEPIVDAKRKAALLEEAIQTHGLSKEHTLAVGDGANDAAMVIAAGLGIAYHAKPYLRERSDVSINHTDLTSLLYIQGYAKEEFHT